MGSGFTKIKAVSDTDFYVYAKNYDIERTFTCGQCFRFTKNEESKYPVEYHGIAYGRYVGFAGDNEGNVHFLGTTREDVENIWLSFLGLDRDYDAIKEQIKEDFGRHPFMLEAIEHAGGLRILAQERFETLCSFILSQNNNIPRISKLVEALCERYGEEVQTPYGVKYSFPKAERLAKADISELYEMKMGYRAKYIEDAAKRVASGRLPLDTLTPENAEEELLQVLGVGGKVCSCIRLFAIADYAAFPVDVWVKRIVANRFDGKLDTKKTGAYGGIAQQYLFCYERETAKEK